MPGKKRLPTALLPVEGMALGCSLHFIYLLLLNRALVNVLPELQALFFFFNYYFLTSGLRTQGESPKPRILGQMWEKESDLS